MSWDFQRASCLPARLPDFCIDATLPRLTLSSTDSAMEHRKEKMSALLTASTNTMAAPPVLPPRFRHGSVAFRSLARGHRSSQRRGFAVKVRSQRIRVRVCRRIRGEWGGLGRVVVHCNAVRENARLTRPKPKRVCAPL